MRNSIRWILVIVIMTTALAVCAQTPENTATPSAGITLSDCQLSAPNLSTRLAARCGTLKVFENRAAASGREIELRVAVIPAVSRSPAPDPLFFLAGGPGEAATESYLSLSFAFDKIHQKREIILVDQRGTGGSNPLNCPNAEDDEFSFETTSEDMRQSIEACLDYIDGDPLFYTTAIAMQDLDQVRQTLGYEQINLYGASYGTRAALAYLHQFPSRVRTAILDGVVPTDWNLGTEVEGDAQRALDLIFARCAAEPDCQQAFPNLPAEFKTILEKIRTQPVELKLDDPISGEPTQFTLTHELFANTIHMMSYAPETASLLPLMIHQAYAAGDYSLLAAQSLATFTTLSESISSGMRFSVMCAEDVPFYQDSGDEGYMGDFFIDTFGQICKYWPKAEIPADFKEPVRSDAPVLLLSGEADPVTPPANAEIAAQTLPNSLQIIVPEQGHINLYRGCVTRLVAEFVEAGSVQGLDSTCVQNISAPPFFVNPSGPKP